EPLLETCSGGDMAQQVIELYREKLRFSICLQLLKDSVTIPCGHSYCMTCIETCWDEKETHSCPQCRQTFTSQPVLVKNIILGELVEDLKAGLTSASSGLPMLDLGTWPVISVLGGSGKPPSPAWCVWPLTVSITFSLTTT
uniref:RING-type domain-containing protein n=1 Tax=Neolamprologus brichardi TaxID=32507 RepID=A0A3Q4GMW9_NEOBR